MEHEQLDDFPLSRRGGRKGYVVSRLEEAIADYIESQEKGGLVFYYAVVNHFRERTHSTRRIEKALRNLVDMGYVETTHTLWESNPLLSRTRREDASEN